MAAPTSPSARPVFEAPPPAPRGSILTKVLGALVFVAVVAIVVLAVAWQAERHARMQILLARSEAEHAERAAMLRAEEERASAPVEQVIVSTAYSEPRDRPRRRTRARAAWRGAQAAEKAAPPTEEAPPAPLLPVRVGAAPSERNQAQRVNRVDDYVGSGNTVAVVVYTASWCPACRHAKAWMDSHRVRYSDRDVDASESNAIALHRYNPRGSIPTFVIGGRVLVGFSPEAVVAAIEGS